MSELEMIRLYSTLPVSVQRAAARLASDMAEQLGTDETHVVVEVLVGAGGENA